MNANSEDFHYERSDHPQNNHYQLKCEEHYYLVSLNMLVKEFNGTQKKV